jgi:hypothetical protein
MLNGRFVLDAVVHAYNLNTTSTARRGGACPSLNFTIIHSGVAFLEETAWLLGYLPGQYS